MNPLFEMTLGGIDADTSWDTVDKKFDFLAIMSKATILLIKHFIIQDKPFLPSIPKISPQKNKQGLSKNLRWSKFYHSDLHYASFLIKSEIGDFILIGTSVYLNANPHINLVESLLE